MHKINLKTDEELEIMTEGGAKLGRVKHALEKAVAPGISAFEIDQLAEKLIREEGGESSFKRVPRYHWSTCVNVNDGIVHGIPSKNLIFKEGDIVSVDVGMYYKGFHTDTSTTVPLTDNKKTLDFLEAGKRALQNAIKEVQIGNYVYDISNATEKTLRAAGYTPVEDLVGHGVGRELHEDPQIPCLVVLPREKTPKLEVGMALAVEIMYTMGSPEIMLDEDRWTIRTSDGTISALYEETVVLTKTGSKVITM